MTETESKAEVPEWFEEHPLYAEAMEQLAGGDGAGAAEQLRQLAGIYPDEEVLRELLLRTELQAAVGSPASVPAEHRPPTPVLRYLLLILLIGSATLALGAGLLAGYDRFVRPLLETRQQEAHIESLRHGIQLRLDAGDWAGAQDLLDELAELVPGDPGVEQARQDLQEQKALDERYVDAVAAQRAGNRAEALTLLGSIEAHSPGYRDVPQRIAQLQEEEALEAIWLEAEGQVQARDWPAVIDLLRQMRARDPDYRRANVEQRLYEVYALLGRQEIQAAAGDLERLRQGLDYLDRALALRPTDQALIADRKLAFNYVKGAEALARQDWAAAVEHWQAVHLSQPDYQGGSLGTRLNELYPQAARQLIAEAGGSIRPLQQALDYLNRALATRPEDEALLAERRRLDDFLAGVEAYGQGYWDLAIAHWGPLYAQQPEYQDGVLRRYLVDACANSNEPDPTYCTP